MDIFRLLYSEPAVRLMQMIHPALAKGLLTGSSSTLAQVLCSCISLSVSPTGISQSRISHWLLQQGSDLSEQKKRAFYRWYQLEKTNPGKQTKVKTLLPFPPNQTFCPAAVSLVGSLHRASDGVGTQPKFSPWEGMVGGMRRDSSKAVKELRPLYKRGCILK